MKEEGAALPVKVIKTKPENNNKVSEEENYNSKDK